MHTPQFSSRTGWNLQTTRFAAALQAQRSAGVHLFDLTQSNPTACGFKYDETGILGALSQPECLRYEPDARGLLHAREAVAQYYLELCDIDAAQFAGTSPAKISPDRIFLTTSTSEAYSYLFRLHCDHGAEVLIAQPSYPLFEFLADLDDVRLVHYPLFYDHGWHIDLAALEARITPQTRAVVLINPNNPTGHYTSRAEWEALERICLDRGLALIVDEVFLEYAIASGSDSQTESLGPPRSFVAGEHPVPTYVLSGLSKAAGLPQMKAAWLVASGPDLLLAEATARLEVIADTFLSMNSPVQHALPYFLATRAGVQRQIRSRARENLTALDRHLEAVPHISRLEVQAGWCVVVRVPALCSGEELAIRLLRDQGVVVHPGYFYGFPGDGWLVLSLLPRPEEFSEGVRRLVNSFAGI